VTPIEAAERLQLSPSSVYRAIRRGDIRATRASGQKGAIRIPVSEVERLVTARRETG
jgi:excisionase family DNA binding protein